MKFEDKCPYCKGEDLEYDVKEPVDSEIRQRVECNYCNKTFSIWSLTDWEVGDEDGIYK